MAGPLKGVTVIELAGIGPGPFAGMMLADMGADVIRVDRPPAGDGGALGALMRNDGVVDRGRRSIALDMKDPRAVEIVLRLVERADVLIEGFRPGVTEKLGLGPEACRARNPRLVYGRITGWGQTGPLAQAAGHDLNYIAISGALHAMGKRDQPPTPPLNLVGDYGGGGMLLALGVVAALFEAQRSGQGQVVDAAMSDGAAVLMAALYGMQAKGFWNDARESNFLDGAAPFYGCYACADGRFISIGPIEPQFYRELLARCGLATEALPTQWNAQEWPALRERLEALFRTRSRDAWCALLEGSDACFAPVLEMREAPNHPHNLARRTFVEAPGGMQPAPAPRFQRTPSVLPGAAPGAGQHSVDILREFGYAMPDIESLVQAQVVGAGAN
ncbi:CaiB/BaiF CoA-transferase family protein [Pseudorhodoferax sp. Leaf274]|uniref:CaiB/BaiF CoA transferase family protein n=1 Tax=Pseudorhodoferax sp. Leaf274 TaxID=1736318 RepID=UPI000702CFE6|nr:CaiB/BaiF CoA-transferase family protein [Pseudorhodoferax sp. Leaf274]KQP45485.1 carnitine dehydratase [Pseudorhodoferax sp. Leaf274]